MRIFGRRPSNVKDDGIPVDGTANDATQGPYYSNVYSINQLIADQNRLPSGKVRTQVTFYLPGVGTKFTAKKGWFAEKKIQLLFGDDIEQLILRAYINLCANYHLSDEIVLIGFSRGAVAARIFSRLVSDFGILAPDMLLHLDELWTAFVDISGEIDDQLYQQKIVTLRQKLAHNARRPVFDRPKGKPIRFLGVFDTVSGPLDNKIMKSIDLRDLCPAAGVQHVLHLMSMHDTRQDFTLKRFESKDTSTIVRELWVPGVHSDVGGGYDARFISNISLLTMASGLKVFGKIALSKDAVKRVREEIATQVTNKAYVINPEPSRRIKKARAICAGDTIHPLHYFLVEQKNVRWKHDELAVTYTDPTGIKEKPIPFLRKFDLWVNRKKIATRGNSAHLTRRAVERSEPAAK